MGSLVVQSYIYFTGFPDDQRSTKVLVTVVLLLEALMTVFAFSGFWESGHAYWNIDPSTQISALISWAPMAGLVTTLTHGFYCSRIWSLQKHRIVPLSIMMLSLVQLASTCYFSQTGAFAVLSTSSPSLASLVVWLGSSIMCDLTITICMILSFRPSQSDFRNSKLKLIKLTRFTIETGLVTTVVAFLELIIGIVHRDQYYHVTIFYVLSKLYANCLLASLNFRLVLRNPTNPNLTDIVQNDLASDMISRQWDTQSAHVVRTYPRAKSVMDITADPNEIRRNCSDEDQTCEVHELRDLSTRV